MKKKVLLILLCVFMLPVFILPMPAKADFDDFTDIGNHWAKASLRKAYNDGVLIGYKDNTMRPDGEITAAEVLTVLTRVLRSDTGKTSGELGLSGKEWYASNVSAAYNMGLFDKNIQFNSPMTRQDAFYAIATAFQLVYAEPDMAPLSDFKDAWKITERNNAAIASLVQDGLIKGYEGELTPDKSMTRAEFVTMIYRVVDSVGGTDGKNFVLTSSELNDRKAENIWIAGKVGDISLNNVKADLLTVRSNNVNSYEFKNVTAGRLALAPVSDFVLDSVEDCSFSVISVGGAGGKITINENSDRIEVTSSSRSIEVNTDFKKLVIGGNGNTVTVTSENAGEIVITGKDNKLVLKGHADSVAVKNGKTVITGGGSFDMLYKYCLDFTCSTEHSEEKMFGLSAAKVTLTVPKVLPAGQKLSVKAQVDGGQLRTGYKAYWTFNGVKSNEFNASLSVKTEYEFEYQYTYTQNNMPKTGTIAFTIVDNETGESRSALATFEIENYPDYYYYKGDILSTVTTGYKGDRTLKWAQEHDYSVYEKELWVNTKGYKSDTQYLIWVSIAYQRCNVFEKKGDSWTLKRSSIVGTGASSTPTPVGVYKTTYKQRGWYTSDYACYPVVRFYAGSGYAFHSRLYQPYNTTVLQDARIGFPISHGCIRMYDEDIQWLYDNIPANTTVVVF